MKKTDVIAISISISMDNGVIHSHTATLPYDGDKYDVRSQDALREFLLLMENVFGEMATEVALQELKDNSLLT